MRQVRDRATCVEPETACRRVCLDRAYESSVSFAPAREIAATAHRCFDISPLRRLQSRAQRETAAASGINTEQGLSNGPGFIKGQKTLRHLSWIKLKQSCATPHHRCSSQQMSTRRSEELGQAGARPLLVIHRRVVGLRLPCFVKGA